jgi:SAM-dependent methyltransferase
VTNINTTEYWDSRYRALGSSPMSVYNKLVVHKEMYLEVISKCFRVLNKRPKARILDLGSGPGFMGYLLHSRGHLNDMMAYCAVDFSEEAEDGFQTFFVGRSNASFVRHNLDNPLPPEVREEKWDLIISTECLEHLTDDLSVLRSMTKLLTSTGKIVVSVPINVNIESHVRNYTTPNRVFDVFLEAGLQVAFERVDRWWIISAAECSLWL